MARIAPGLLALLMLGCTKAELGEPCASSSECASGLCLDGLPGGLCSTTCDDGSCDESAECVDLAGEAYCLPRCQGPDDCRQGYACSLGHCDLPCGSDDECPAYAACDSATAGCVHRQGQPLGAPCITDSQCETDLCVGGDEPAFGVCSRPCGGEALCAPGLPCGLVLARDDLYALCRAPAGPGEAGDLCASGEDCASGVCERGTCVYPCAEDGSCAGGAPCREGEVHVAGAGPMTAEFCEPLAAPGVHALDLGEVPTDRGCAHVEFDAPEDVVSFAVVAWTAEPIVIAPRNLLTPDGRVLLDDHGIGPVRAFDLARERTVLVPDSDDPAVAVVAGLHSIDLCAYELGGTMLVDAALRVRVLIKVREGGVCSDGHMVMNVHLAPHFYGSLDASGAPSSPYLTTALDRVRHFYDAQCHVAFEEVRFYDMTDRFGVIGSEDELHEMFALVSTGAPRAAVNLFMVRDLSGVSEWVAGISGGLPGPPGVGGTAHSGVAVESNSDAEITGDTMAHELGHFLGLWHPTEMNGMSQDPILDTETCSFDPERPYEMARCATYDNIMFPVLTGTADVITPGQCFVVRGNPGL